MDDTGPKQKNERQGRLRTIAQPETGDRNHVRRLTACPASEDRRWVAFFWWWWDVLNGWATANGCNGRAFFNGLTKNFIPYVLRDTNGPVQG